MPTRYGKAQLCAARTKGPPCWKKDPSLFGGRCTDLRPKGRRGIARESRKLLRLLGMRIANAKFRGLAQTFDNVVKVSIHLLACF